MQHKLRQFVSHRLFQLTILLLIVFNAVILGLETSKPIMERYGTFIHQSNNIILGIFTIEIVLRLLAFGGNFFKKGLNWFDFVIVATSIVAENTTLAALRAFRLFRLFRLFSVVPDLQVITISIGRAIPGIGSITFMILILFYVYSLLGIKFFGEAFPHFFGSLGKSAFSLFQIMTLESWSMAIVRPIMEVYPHAWIFFVSYLIISSFTMLNLFVALIVHVMDRTGNEISRKVSDQQEIDIQKEVVELRKEIRAIRTLLEKR